MAARESDYRENGSEGPTGAAVYVLDASGCFSFEQRQWLAGKTNEAMKGLGTPQGSEVRVRLVGDVEMAVAHRDHLGVETTTDVLTFDLDGGANGKESTPRPLDVDLLVCADEAKRQAASRGIEPEREALLYVIHGLLHCLGHDDADDEGAALMHEREDEVLSSIGVGATFVAERAEAPPT